MGRGHRPRSEELSRSDRRRNAATAIESHGWRSAFGMDRRRIIALRLDTRADSRARLSPQRAERREDIVVRAAALRDGGDVSSQPRAADSRWQYVRGVVPAAALGSVPARRPTVIKGYSSLAKSSTG